MASKFFEHFIGITDAMNSLGGTGLWDEEDGFYYDQLKVERANDSAADAVARRPAAADRGGDSRDREDQQTARLQEAHGVVPQLPQGPGVSSITYCEAVPASPATGCWRSRHASGWSARLRYMLDENEFFSPHGLRSVSRVHREKPYIFRAGNEEHRVDYVPGEGNSYLFGGNSNWRGPIWFPINFLIVEALERYHHLLRRISSRSNARPVPET